MKEETNNENITKQELTILIIEFILGLNVLQPSEYDCNNFSRISRKEKLRYLGNQEILFYLLNQCGENLVKGISFHQFTVDDLKNRFSFIKKSLIEDLFRKLHFENCFTYYNKILVFNLDYFPEFTNYF
jgi:hypothetical protein